jgi:hypothetical protein
MEDILALILIFGGGTLVAISFSPVGRAIADRIRSRGTAAEPDPAVYEELERLRGEVAELHERMEFTERMLAAKREPDRLGSV